MAAMRVESIDDLRARKADRRTEADDLRMELQVRGDEARELVDDLGPLVRRLDFYAKEHGPAAQATVNAVAHRLIRFRRQWEPATPGDAA